MKRWLGLFVALLLCSNIYAKNVCDTLDYSKFEQGNQSQQYYNDYFKCSLKRAKQNINGNITQLEQAKDELYSLKINYGAMGYNMDEVNALELYSRTLYNLTSQYMEDVYNHMLDSDDYLDELDNSYYIVSNMNVLQQTKFAHKYAVLGLKLEQQGSFKDYRVADLYIINTIAVLRNIKNEVAYNELYLVADRIVNKYTTRNSYITPTGFYGLVAGN